MPWKQDVIAGTPLLRDILSEEDLPGVKWDIHGEVVPKDTINNSIQNLLSKTQANMCKTSEKISTHIKSAADNCVENSNMSFMADEF